VTTAPSHADRPLKAAAATTSTGPIARTMSIFARELGGYFSTPVAYVFIVIFLILTGVFTFNRGFGAFYERGQADLQPFFQWHPWLYLFLIPAVSMRLWAEERKSGTIELLLTLPISLGEAVLGKFLAAWAFTGIALLLTLPMWITVNVLGDPDNGAIAAAYLGSFLMAGGFLAIGSLVSASTKSQVIAFVVTAVACLVFLLAGHPPVLEAFSGWAPRVVIEAISSFSFLTHFAAISRGVVAATDVVFFLSLIAAFLVGAAVVVEMKKA
jgi:ABC-2 type transport system permease protein